MLGTEVAGAEAAVTDDALGGFLALLEVATGLAGRHCGLCGRGWFGEGEGEIYRGRRYRGTSAEERKRNREEK